MLDSELILLSLAQVHRELSICTTIILTIPYKSTSFYYLGTVCVCSYVRLLMSVWVCLCALCLPVLLGCVPGTSLPKLSSLSSAVRATGPSLLLLGFVFV